MILFNKQTDKKTKVVYLCCVKYKLSNCVYKYRLKLKTHATISIKWEPE